MFFVGKQQQQEGELAGVCKGPGSSWVMLKVGDGERGPGRIPTSAAACQCPGTHSLWLPLLSPALSSACRGRGARVFVGRAFWGDLGVTPMPGWGHGR